MDDLGGNTPIFFLFHVQAATMAAVVPAPEEAKRWKKTGWGVWEIPVDGGEK